MPGASLGVRNTEERAYRLMKFTSKRSDRSRLISIMGSGSEKYHEEKFFLISETW